MFVDNIKIISNKFIIYNKVNIVRSTNGVVIKILCVKMIMVYFINVNDPYYILLYYYTIAVETESLKKLN